MEAQRSSERQPCFHADSISWGCRVLLPPHSCPSSWRVSGPACACCTGCFLVPHTAGLSKGQASGEVTHRQGVITAVSIPRTPWKLKVVVPLSAYLGHCAGMRVPQFPAVTITGLLRTSCRRLFHLCGSFTACWILSTGHLLW